MSSFHESTCRRCLLACMTSVCQTNNCYNGQRSWCGQLLSTRRPPVDHGHDWTLTPSEQRCWHHLCVSVIRGQRSTSTTWLSSTWLSSTTTASRRYSTIFYLCARYDVNVVHRSYCIVWWLPTTSTVSFTRGSVRTSPTALSTSAVLDPGQLNYWCCVESHRGRSWGQYSFFYIQ